MRLTGLQRGLLAAAGLGFVAIGAIEATQEDALIRSAFAGEPGFSRPFHDHTYAWPAIGTDAYSASCTITRFWEDGSAVASCTEDGATYVYDPDGQYVPNIPGNPVRDPGWYVEE